MNCLPRLQKEHSWIPIFASNMVLNLELCVILFQLYLIWFWSAKYKSKHEMFKVHRHCGNLFCMKGKLGNLGPFVGLILLLGLVLEKTCMVITPSINIPKYHWQLRHLYLLIIAFYWKFVLISLINKELEFLNRVKI